ncbi:hypothetical protein BGI67_07910, partial [Oenococcus oeni]
VGEFDEQIKDSKYADTYQGVKDKAADVIDQASPYVEKAKDKAYDLVDKASPYVDKAKDTIDDLRHRFSKEDIDLEEDDALKDDLTKPDSDEKEDK